MPKQLPPFQCPRCTYSTARKDNMRGHLYNLKKTCPAAIRDVTLTEAIKEYILANRVYHVKDETKITNQTINTYNTMNNFLSSMDAVEKITKLSEYAQIDITPLEDKIESKYLKCVRRLEKDSFKIPHTISKTQLMGIVDDLTKAIRGSQRNEFLEDLNFIYDAKRKRINVYSGRWEEHLVVNGIEYLIGNIKDYYLDAYEIYLMRNICKSGATLQGVNDSSKCLEDYYHFLACFDIDPYCKDNYDNKILYNEDDSRYNQEPAPDDDEGFIIVRRFTKMYNDIYGAITNTERKSKHKELLDIIKSNSKNNLEELDKNIIDLVKVDADFKEGIFERRAIEV